jgi:lipopolysaccharide export system permease protein
MFRARTLRYYIGRRFALMIMGALVVCMALIFMVDMIELLRQARSAKTVTMGQLALIGFLRLHVFTEILIPFAVLVGSIGALMTLSRKSELSVMRAGGMSVWQFCRPGFTVAALIGIVTVVLYNPFAAASMARAEQLMATTFGGQTQSITAGDGNWLRQDGIDGPSVMTANAVSDRGLTLSGITIYQYDKQGQFVEQVLAKRGVLQDGFWELSGVSVVRAGQEPELHNAYNLSTTLDRARILNALGSIHTVSVFELPAVIDLAEKSQLPVARFKIQYEMLLARPLLLIAMVLLAATVSLRSFRQGGIQTMVSTGIVGGVGFFLLTEVSRQVGLAGLVPAVVAVWLPVVIACLFATTVLLVQEDG